MQIDKLYSIKNCKTLIYGDFVVDKYIIGKVKRVSVDGPVPILEVQERISRLGGAGNFVSDVVELGGTARVIGCVGDDNDGRWILEKLSEKNVDVRYVHMKSDIRTIVKTRIVSKNQQYVRLDEEDKAGMNAEYAEFIKDNIDKILSDINVVIIADINKGVITAEIAQFIIKTANEYKIPVVVSPRGDDYSKYSGATVCTPNLNELREVTGENLDTYEEIIQAGLKVREDMNFKYLMLTRSEKGITIFNSNNSTANFPTKARDMVDVTGAGDAVATITALGLGVGYEIEDCCRLANLAASIVCSKFGIATVSISELLEDLLYTGEFKSITLDLAKFTAESLKEKGKKIVFMNGFFDLLHAGHVVQFAKAKAMGDVLIVGVYNDDITKSLLGEGRPIVNEKNRIAMLGGLESIDYILLMDEEKPDSILEIIKPDVFYKGSEWADKEIPEKELVESYGGIIKIFDAEKTESTNNIINKIVENNHR
jgi:D-beta-D-heptose 7-phosphate kinase/D-beta-D-heptose 1-phosphate adenosyltransferase